MQDTLHTFKLKSFFIIIIKCIDFCLNLATILKMVAILDSTNFDFLDTCILYVYMQETL